MNKQVVMSSLLFLVTLAMAGGASFAMVHHDHKALTNVHHDHEVLVAFGHGLVGLHISNRHQRHHGHTSVARQISPFIGPSTAHLSSEGVHLMSAHYTKAAFSETHASHHEGSTHERYER